MSTSHRNEHELREVFEELLLSRKINKKAKGTQTAPKTNVSVPGELPDDSVMSIIEMLRPSVRQLRAKNDETLEKKELSNEMCECEVENISVDRSKTTVTKNHSTQALREVFEELGLSGTWASSEQDVTERPSTPNGEIPDDEVSSIIEMLRPSIRQLYANKNNGISVDIEKKEIISKSNLEESRHYKSEPAVPMQESAKVFLFSTEISETSLDSTTTLQSTGTENLGEDLIRTMLSTTSQLYKKDECPEEGKKLVHTASNTDNSKRRRRRSSKRWKTKQVTDHSTGSEAPDDQLDTEAGQTVSTEYFKDDKEIEETQSTKTETVVDDEVTVLRSGTEWTETPFLVPAVVENVEESTSTVESEPTRGCPNTFQYKIQFSRPDKNICNTQKELNRFKAILHTGKRYEEQKKCQNAKGDCEKIRYCKPNEVCALKVDLSNKCGCGKNGAVGGFGSQCSFNTITRSFSDTSLSSMSYCTSYLEEMSSLPCFCAQVPMTPSPSPGKAKVFWAITKINVYADNSRTYEVMPLTGKKPAELPEKSDSVFVLIPPKQGPSVQSNLS